MSHVPSEMNRAMVVALGANGCQQNRIAEHLSIDAKTLRKHYSQELNFGVETLLAKVAGNLAMIAIRGKGSAAVAAAKYILGCRGGWRDVARLEVEPVGAFDGADCAREIIARKLDQLAARNSELEQFTGRKPLDS